MLGIDPGLVDAIAIGVGSPLWFLAAYMVVQALTPLMNALHERYGARVLGVLFAAALAVDLVRQRLVVVVGVSNVPSDGYGFGQELIGIPNIVFVWLFAQQVGFVMFDAGTPGARGGSCSRSWRAGAACSRHPSPSSGTRGACSATNGRRRPRWLSSP